MSVKITIKHGKNKYANFEIKSEESFEDFQAKIFSLTQVPCERQKIVYKAKKIQNTNDLKSIDNKATITLMGTAESTIETKEEKVQFVEDMSTAQKHELMSELPCGLYNLGNTCYLNSALQCLKGIPELKSLLKEKALSQEENLSANLGRLFQNIDSNTDAVVPQDFVTYFRTQFPRFATRGDHGEWQQQDADECLTEILQTLRNELRIEETAQFNWIDKLFRGEFETDLKCVESNEESKGTETFLKLQCFIDEKTRHVNDGIKISMDEDLEKQSQTLQRNAIWKKTRTISRLPKYLPVQMVRFFWKQQKQKNAKVLRSVVFPEKLDLHEFCNDHLKAIIGKYRKMLIDKENKAREKNQSVKNDNENKDNEVNNQNSNNNNNVNNDKNNDNNNNNNNNNNTSTNNNDNNNNNSNNNQNQKQEEKMDVDNAINVDNAELETGYYELIGLVAHKGLSANSGHYIGYVKTEKRGWLKFDDENVAEINEQDLKNLYGGGQWQMAYELFYRKIEPKL